MTAFVPLNQVIGQDEIQPKSLTFPPFNSVSDPQQISPNISCSLLLVFVELLLCNQLRVQLKIKAGVFVFPRKQKGHASGLSGSVSLKIPGLCWASPIWGLAQMPDWLEMPSSH